MEGLKARLGLLEVLVSRLTRGEMGGPGAGVVGGSSGPGPSSQSGLQEALTKAMGERNQLQGEKQRLEREVEGLHRRVEEMRRETERLRNKPCPPQVPPSPPLQDSGLRRPAGGERENTPYTLTTHI